MNIADKRAAMAEMREARKAQTPKAQGQAQGRGLALGRQVNKPEVAVMPDLPEVPEPKGKGKGKGRDKQ